MTDDRSRARGWRLNATSKKHRGRHHLGTTIRFRRDVCAMKSVTPPEKAGGVRAAARRRGLRARRRPGRRRSCPYAVASLDICVTRVTRSRVSIRLRYWPPEVDPRVGVSRQVQLAPARPRGRVVSGILVADESRVFTIPAASHPARTLSRSIEMISDHLLAQTVA